ncbi:hypothetical protein ABIA43_000583 [Bradyrhizobium sp. USDA 328]
MERSECEAGWGDLSSRALPDWRGHPTPLALRAIDPPPPGEGKKQPPYSITRRPSSAAQ